MEFLNNILGGVTSSLTDQVAEKAKSSAISTLEDPAFKGAVSKFVKDLINENKVVLVAVVGSCLLLSSLAIVNILTSFRSRK